MGNSLSVLYGTHKEDKLKKHVIPVEEVSTLCMRWRKLRSPETMTPNEFQKAIVQNKKVKLNYKKFYDSGSEIQVIEFLTGLIILSSGSLEDRLKCLFKLYCVEDQSCMMFEELSECLENSLMALCNLGEVQTCEIDQPALDDFCMEISGSEAIDFTTFKDSIRAECYKFAEIVQQSYTYIRSVSTILIENPFQVIPYLQKGSLFLGKYEIIETPQMKKYVSSTYKQKYKHANLNVKPMLGNEGSLSFELIYLVGVQADKNFRQNYFREIVLKNKLTDNQINEFGELPGGLLYKRVFQFETSQMTLEDYFQNKAPNTQARFENSSKKFRLKCLDEEEAIGICLQLLEQLETLHKIQVIHSNVEPDSVYLLGDDINKLAFLDLELAIWDPLEILGIESRYFKQLPEDKYDTSFRDRDYLAPEHKELAEEYRRTSRIPKQNITYQCDLYGIGAIIYRGLTGTTVGRFSEKTSEHSDLGSKREYLTNWECPHQLKELRVSNSLCSFLIKILAKDPNSRYKDIQEVRSDILKLQEELKSIPEELLEGLEHKTPKDEFMFSDDCVLDLRKHSINDFTLEYLLKFIMDSRITNIRVFGGILPLYALRENKTSILDLSGQKLHSEELRLLSQFIAINQSLRILNLSNNPLMQRHESQHTPQNTKVTIAEMSFREFINSLKNHTNLVEFRLSNVCLGNYLLSELVEPLKQNPLTILDLSYCNLGPTGIEEFSQLCANCSTLNYLNLSGNSIGGEGSKHLASIIQKNHNIAELEIANNQIGNRGAKTIARAITDNFTIENINIKDNTMDTNESELISQSVAFNTQYAKFKSTNKKYGEYAYNLIAESIKKWVESHKFVVDKLNARLNNCEDEIDRKLTEILLDSKGNLNLKPVPLKYSYNPGEGTVHFEYNKKK